MSVAENLKALRKAHGMTQKDMAAIAGVSDKAVWTWENETVPPKVGYLTRIAEHFGVPISSLIEPGGVVAMDGAKKYRARPDEAKAPLYGRIAAGTPIEMLPVDDELWVRPDVLADHPKGFYLRVTGESMNRVLPDGCFAFVDPEAVVSNGDVAALNVNGHDATVKRYFRGSSSITLAPDSTDTAFKDLILDYSIPGTDEVSIIGKVVWFVAPYGERL